MTTLLPEFSDAPQFYHTLEVLYGVTEAQRICEVLAGDHYHCFWRNPLIPPEHGEELPQGMPVPGCSDMWMLPVAAQVTRSPAAQRGSIYIQNPASRFAVDVLAPQPHQEVLDLAAAPGGKTLAIAAAMMNSGRIAAVEPIAARFHRMRANLQRCGVTNVAYYQKDGRGVGRQVPQRFDRVLLDAPCSSEGRFRWDNPDSYQHWSLRKVKECQRKQKSLLRSAYAALKPGGDLVYCTCSFSVEENELVVAHLVNKTDAQVRPIETRIAPPSSRPGVLKWRGRTLPTVLTDTLRVLPDPPWDGFYLACISKPA